MALSELEGAASDKTPREEEGEAEAEGDAGPKRNWADMAEEEKVAEESWSFLILLKFMVQ